MANGDLSAVAKEEVAAMGEKVRLTAAQRAALKQIADFGAARVRLSAASRLSKLGLVELRVWGPMRGMWLANLTAAGLAALASKDPTP